VRFGLLSLPARGIFVSAVFCWLVGYGWWTGRLGHRTALVFAALYLAGAVGFPYLELSRWAFVAWIAVLDVAAAFIWMARD
jgi:hypothetical protein